MDGNKSLTLALVWQMMRAYTLSLLAQVQNLTIRQVIGFGRLPVLVAVLDIIA